VCCVADEFKKPEVSDIEASPRQAAGNALAYAVQFHGIRLASLIRTNVAVDSRTHSFYGPGNNASRQGQKVLSVVQLIKISAFPGGLRVCTARKTTQRAGQTPR
jgi:hypothetical protein